MGNKRFQTLRLFFVASDLIIINLAFYLSYLIFLKNSFFGFSGHVKCVTLLNSSWLISALLFNVYKHSHIVDIQKSYKSTGKSGLLQIALFFSLLIMLTHFKFNGTLILFYSGVLTALFLLSRLYQTYLYEFIFRRFKIAKKIAIIGNDKHAIKLAEYFNNNKQLYSLSGFFADDYNQLQPASPTPIQPIENCIKYAIKNDIKELYTTLSPGEVEGLSELIAKAEENMMKIRFVTPKEKASGNKRYFRLDGFNNMAVMSLRSEPLTNITNRIKKRLFDLVISSLVIICVLSWLIPLLGIIIKLTSKGPVFFLQERSGKDNKTFQCIKFRSMRINSESHEKQASKNDNRITAIGRLMRKTSLDEFPQFLNVFIGDMSITGPRPHMLSHTDEYRKIINRYMVRHFIKPGITGWAQVRGYRGETGSVWQMEKRVENDMWYMENWSLMLDVRILFLTIINILKGEENAY